MREIGKNAFAIEEEGEEWQASASSQVQIALKSSAESKGSRGGLPRGFRGPGHVTPLHAPIAARDVGRASRKAGDMDEK
jgi:hypothetical protein